MFIAFLRENIYASYFLTILRVYIGWKWLTGGWGKITGDFSAEGFLKGKIANPVMSHNEIVYPSYVSFLEKFALPNADLFSYMVAWGEFLVGLGLILGAITTVAAFFGIVMNFAFLYAGTISSNPWMIMLTLFIIVAGQNAGHLGVDRWLIPWIKNLFNDIINNKD